MDKHKLIPLLLVSSLVLVMVFGVVSYSVVQAQDETPTAPVQGSDTQGNTTDSKPMRVGLRGGYSDDQLAAALEIDVEALQTARQAALEKALAQAVDQGLITQAQADQYAQNGGGRHMMGGRLFENSGIDVEALLADELGITADELEAAETQAFNGAVDQAVADGNLTSEQADLMKGQRALRNDANFQASMQSAFKAAVNQAVQSGLITQSQADQILAISADGFGRGGMDFFSGPGGHGGHGGRGGMHNDNDLDNLQNPTPSDGA